MSFKELARKFWRKNAELSFPFKKADVVVDIDAEGTPLVSLNQIKSVGLHNLIDVEFYNLATTSGLSSHYVKFKDGGEISLAYNQAGQLIDFSASKVSIAIGNDGEILFKSRFGNGMN